MCWRHNFMQIGLQTSCIDVHACVKRRTSVLLWHRSYIYVPYQKYVVFQQFYTNILRACIYGSRESCLIYNDCTVDLYQVTLKHDVELVKLVIISYMYIAFKNFNFQRDFLFCYGLETDPSPSSPGVLMSIPETLLSRISIFNVTFSSAMVWKLIPVPARPVS